MGKPSSSPHTSFGPPPVVDYAVSGLVTVAAKVFSSLFMSLFFVMRIPAMLSARLRGEKPEPAKSDKRPEVVCISQERFPGWVVYQSKESFAASKYTEKRIAAKISR
ncbi:hypothetical protein FTW19_14465 [Terriglobus albidus]|uniref:Uncharacterized protein n=1 Tax=Terriglobus albidus TaxID=1592106 RepID=A0A5B9EBT9_9BACT|nr:hypothetical protein [Terriglobus albidus]QEE29094.1 hypothetical protein FTW19_14465 [Terriglobus albidus]